MVEDNIPTSSRNTKISIRLYCDYKLMSIGSFFYNLRQRYRHGLTVAYYRDIVRPQILNTPPIDGLVDSQCEIHLLTSAEDWLNSIWALKSFYTASARKYTLCIHDDGTLHTSAIRQLQEHFPDGRLISRDQALRDVLPSLDAYPRCRAFRETNHLSPKLFDFRNELRSDRMLLMDSDVLFFSEPTELLRRIEDKNYLLNSVNEDIATAYTVNPTDVKSSLGLHLPERFNSGLGIIHRSSLRLDWIEEFLRLPGILGHFWRIEQTLFALCSAKFGVEMLPAEYRISLSAGINDCVAKHYVGAVRHLMYREGIRRLSLNPAFHK